MGRAIRVVYAVRKHAVNAVQWRHETDAHLTARPPFRTGPILELAAAPGCLAAGVEAARTVVDACEQGRRYRLPRACRQRMAAPRPPSASSLT